MGALSEFDRARQHVVLFAEIAVAMNVRSWQVDATYTNTRISIMPDLELGNYKITAVTADGTSLTERASATLVNSNSGSWYHDRANRTLYVRTSGNEPWNEVILPTISLAFSSSTRVMEDRVYDGRILSIPQLSQRIEPFFGGVVQNGGGALELANNDGLFNTLYLGNKQPDPEAILWENATVTLKYGADIAGTAMAYADLRTLGTWRVDGATLSDQSLVLDLLDTKARLEKKLPVSVYSRDDYPTIRESDIGDAIPIAYGVCRGVEPALIDPGARKFKVAGHAISSFMEVRVLDENNDFWNRVSFATVDTANGEFTLASADWENDKPVSVDFVGKPHSSGYPMTNAADVIEDLLTTIGETDTVSADFTAAVAILDIGPNSNNERTVEFPINLHIDERREAGEVIAEVAKTAGLYVTTNTSGQWSVSVFEPEQGEDLTRITEDEILSFTEEREARDGISAVTVKYRNNLEEDESQSEEVTNVRTRRNFASSVEYREIEAPLLEDIGPARHWGQRYLLLDGSPQTYYKIKLPFPFLNVKPGDFIWLDDNQRGRDEVIEVLSTKISIGSDTTIEIMAGLCRGYARHCGFWMDASDTLPARMGGGSLDWPALGTAEQYTWLPQNSGHWCDTDDTPGDAVYAPSRWI